MPKDEIEEFNRYLQNLTEPPNELSEHLAKAVREMWEKLSSRVPGIRPPIAGSGGELGFEFAWKGDDYYLDIDIAPDGKFDWYYKNRITGESCEATVIRNEPFFCLIDFMFAFCCYEDIASEEMAPKDEEENSEVRCD